MQKKRSVFEQELDKQVKVSACLFSFILAVFHGILIFKFYQQSCNLLSLLDPINILMFSVCFHRHSLSRLYNSVTVLIRKVLASRGSFHQKQSED